MVRAGLLAAAVLACASFGLAAAISIPNSSFEAGTGFDPGQPSSWNHGQTLGNAGAGGFLQVLSNSAFFGKDLNNYLFINADGGPVDGAGTTTRFIWTDSLGTYAANTVYTLTVALATTADFSPNRSAILSLQADGTTVQSTTKLFTDLSDTQFQDFSVIVDTDLLPGVIGQNISVMITHSVTNEMFGKSLAVDNVRLDASPVPEPAVLGTLGVSGLLALRRRHRSH
jgi:hypothetical protein